MPVLLGDRERHFLHIKDSTQLITASWKRIYCKLLHFVLWFHKRLSSLFGIVKANTIYSFKCFWFLNKSRDTCIFDNIFNLKRAIWCAGGFVFWRWCCVNKIIDYFKFKFTSNWYSKSNPEHLFLLPVWMSTWVQWIMAAHHDGNGMYNKLPVKNAPTRSILILNKSHYKFSKFILFKEAYA